ncbi:MAG: hypothetical protein HKO71_05180, partial [Pseudomonadales bacterium]|nr:hypothetical protein [Pseudomonadales bacterium]
DCIDMLPVATGKASWSWALPDPTVNPKDIIASDRYLNAGGSGNNNHRAA